MLIFKLLIIFFCVLYGQETVGAAKRIKRNSEIDGNRTKVSRDFAVVESAINKEETKSLATDINVNNKPSKITTDKQTEPNKETITTFYDEMLHNVDSSLKKRKIPHISRSISKTRNTHTTRGRNVAAVLENLRRTPMAYIFHEQENKFPEYVDHFVAATSGQSNDKLKDAPAEVVIIDNAPNVIPSVKDHINLHQCVEKSSKHIEGEKEHNGETKYILKGLSHILNIPDERNRAFAAANAKMIDNQFIPIHNPMIGGNAFTPLERMFKLANMFMYNMGNEDPIPVHTQSAQMAFVPYTPFNQPELLNDDPESIDYILNVIGSPADVYNAVIAKSAVGQQPDNLQQPLNKNEHSHDAALIFKQPVAANDNKVVDLIENALDTLLSSSGEVDNNNEIEVRCPIHREQKHNYAENTSGDGNATKGTRDGDVIQVCSCHFVQKKKADDSTPVKTTK